MNKIFQWFLLVPASLTAGFLATVMLDFSLSVSLNFAMIDPSQFAAKTVIKTISYVSGGIATVYCAFVMAPNYQFRVINYLTLAAGILILIVVITALQIGNYWLLYYAFAFFAGTGGITFYLHMFFESETDASDTA